MDEGDGNLQNYQLSYGIGGRDSRTRIVVGGNYVRQDEISSGSRDISQFPTPGATACDNTCSSGTPSGRFIVLGQDLTLVAPVIGRAPTVADFRPFAGAPDRFKLRTVQTSSASLERYAFVNAPQGSARTSI